MKAEEYLKAFQKAGQIKVDEAGNYTGSHILVQHIGKPAKLPFAGIPQKLDKDGDPSIDRIPRKLLDFYIENGWEVVRVIPVPKSLKPIDNDNVDSNEQEDRQGVPVHRGRKKSN